MIENDDKKVTILIPAFNEEKTIGKLLSKIKSLQKDWEIIVVNDGSSDNMSKVVKDLEVKIITHPYNKGYGAALKTGICASQNENILTMDADGQHNPEDIERIIDSFGVYDMVIGCRTKESHKLLFRKPGKVILRWVACYLSGFKIPDLNSGFRLFRKSKVLEFIHMFPNSFSFSTTITLAFYHSGYNIKYIPIISGDRKGGKSRVKQIRDGVQTILLIIRITMLFNPFKVFLPISVFLFLVGLIYALVSFILVRFHIPTGAVLLILSSIIIFLVGALADQIAAIRFEQK